jgi:hypothetical protein
MYECRRSAITNLTECALWHYDNTFIFTNQSEVDFGIAYVCPISTVATGLLKWMFWIQDEYVAPVPTSKSHIAPARQRLYF